jgi:hypothetical protein
MCVPSSAKVPLTSSGLRGGAVSSDLMAIDCPVGKHVLVRIRATVDGSSALRPRARVFLATNAPATQAKLAVRTLAGKPISYADVAASGRTRLFTAKGCGPA